MHKFLFPLLLLVPSASSLAGYRIQDLGALRPGGDSSGSALNDGGSVVGSASTASTTVAARYDSRTGLVDIGSSIASSRSSGATGINASGLAVGSFVDASTGRSQIFTSREGQTTALTLSGDSRFQNGEAWASGVNNAGEIVGRARLNTGQAISFRASADGSASIIATPAGSIGSSAAGINQSGTVVGSYTMTYGVSRIYTAAEGQAGVDLLKSYGPSGFGLNSYGTGINNLGDVAGYADFNGQSHALLASHLGTLTDIGAGYSGSTFAAGINDLAHVVGRMGGGSGQTRAFYWDRDSGLVDLNSMLSATDQANWTLTSATAINGIDQITGQGYINGQLHAFLLTRDGIVPGAIPEPASILLVAAGLGMVVATSARKMVR